MSGLSALPASERISALGTALAEVSALLDKFLADGVLTSTNLFSAQKYVPGYVFSFVRDAHSIPKYDDLLRTSHAPFIDMVTFRLAKDVPGADTAFLEALQKDLLLPSADSTEHAAETRALHMRTMLLLGWGLVKEIAREAYWDMDPELWDRCETAYAMSNPPLRYSNRSDVVSHVVDKMRAAGLTREADYVRVYLNYNPVTHG